MAFLEIEDLSVRFGGHSAIGAVDHCSFSIEAGSRTVLLGETGSGKSVLLLALLKLLPPQAQITGAVRFGGQNLLALKPSELEKIRGAQIAYIPQGSGGGLNPLLRVAAQVGEPLVEHRGWKKSAALRRSVELLEEFQIPPAQALGYPHMFSGGMRQRAMVAMGISAGATLLLADEPTKGLDARRIGLVAQSFEALQGKTLLCVTHDVRFARRIGQQICVMYAAQQLEQAPRDSFFAQPLHPYSQALLDALPENGLQSRVGFAPAHSDYASTGCRFAARCPWRTARCAKTPPMVEVGAHKVRCWRYVH